MPRAKKQRQGLKVVTRKGTTQLYLRGTVRGRRVYETTGTDDPQLAEEARATREAEIYRSAIHGEKPKIPWAKAALGYLTQPGVKHSTHTKAAIRRVAEVLGPKITCDEVDQGEHNRVATVLCKPDAKSATIVRAVTTPIRAVLTYAQTMGWCTAPKFKKAEKGGKRTDWFKPAEAEALIEAAAPHLQPLLTFLFCTGARMSEAIALEWSDVDIQHARCTFQGERDEDSGTKNGDDRIVDLPERAVLALANMRGMREGPVFLYPERTPTEIKFRNNGEIHLGRGGGVVGHIVRKADGWEVHTSEGVTTHETLTKAKNAFRAAIADQAVRRMVPYRLSGTNKFGTGGGQIKTAWSTAMRNAKIGRHLTPHHCRHTWASWHYCMEKDLLKLRDDGGWRTTSECERYAKLVPNGYRGQIVAFLSGQPLPSAGSVQSPANNRLSA